jgi:hypothetical protein
MASRICPHARGTCQYIPTPRKAEPTLSTKDATWRSPTRSDENLQMAAQKLHADDTPVPVLAPGNGKTKTGRLWTYVRDDRPAGDESPPAVWFAYTPDRKGEHPKAHLSTFTGTLQADACAGYNPVYETGRVREAGCMAHVRRKFYDLVVAHKSSVATEALERIAKLYAVEKETRGQLPEQRREVRNLRSRPLLDSLKQWLEETLGKLSRKSDTAVAVRYALGQWKVLELYCDDGRLEIDNNSAERALRTVKTIFPVGVSTCSERETNSMPRDRNSSKARKRWETDRANRSNFQTTTASKRLLLASALRRFSSGRESFAPDTPASTYSPTNSQPRCLQYSRSSRSCISGFWPLLAVDTRA